MDKYFKRAGDLTDNHIPNNENYIKKYLLEIVSEKTLDDNIIGAGSMIISFNDLKKMVEEDCYNFISAEYLNPEMIIVQYEKYQKENSRKI